MSGPFAITAFVVAILLAIMLHELGHFIAARRFGMRADRFFLGFGPTVVSRRRGETEFGIKALPLGGFVRILGMSPIDERRAPVVDDVLAEVAEVDEAVYAELARVLDERGTPADVVERVLRRLRAGLEDPADVARARAVLHEILVTETTDTGRPGDLHHRLLRGDEGRFFTDRPAWQRAVVLAAGSAAHFAIAIVVLVGVYAFLPVWTGGFEPQVAGVQDDSPAAVAGLQPGDRVLAVGDVRSGDYEVLREEIRQRPGQPTVVTIERQGRERSLLMTPAPVVEPASGETIGVVGFSPEVQMQRMAPLGAVEHALLGTPDLGNPGGFVPMFTGSVSALVSVFSPSGIADILAQATGQQERGLEGAVSLIGAASIAGQVGGDAVGLVLFFGLIALVNVFIGIFNLVPLPPLDGGHLAALGIERTVNAVRRMRGATPDFVVDPRALIAVAVPVIAVLSVVVLALFWLDITDPIRLG